MNAVVALSKCSKTNKMYGIRFERTDGTGNILGHFLFKKKLL